VKVNAIADSWNVNSSFQIIKRAASPKLAKNPKTILYVEVTSAPIHSPVKYVVMRNRDTEYGCIGE